MIVDLVTNSRILEELMLSEYHEKIFVEQIGKVGKKEDRRYIFMSLDYEELSKFLRKRAGYIPFTIAIGEKDKIH